MFRTVPLLIGLLLLQACAGQSERAANLDESSDGGESDSPIVHDCSGTGATGCPCTEKGAIAECQTVTNTSGNYASCATGHSTCNGATWGDCLGNRVISGWVASGSLRVDSKNTMWISTTGDNDCEPTSTTLTGELTDVPDAGVSITDVGISIQPSTGTTQGSGPCKGLWCQVVSCGGGVTTTLSGKVYDPAGKNPLYNAYVYVPVDANAALPTLSEGVSCDTCAGADSVSAVAVAQTGSDGSFVLQNVPAGTGIPLVVQMGKWRRKVTLPTITSCADNAIATDYTRLPRNTSDGEVADIPRMALASGSADPFECLLLKAGIDPAEITLPGEGGRIEYYVYNGVDLYPGGAPDGGTLTGELTTLEQYDVVLLPCEGQENNHNADVPNLVDYAAEGGRVFTTHYGYAWLATPQPTGVASNLSEFYGTANWAIGRNDYNDPMTATIDQSFPKGLAFAEWLENVGATTTQGSISIKEPRHNALSAIAGTSQRWVYGLSKVATAGTPDMLLAMTFNTPVGAEETAQCGRVVFSDFHVSADAQVDSNSTCTADSDCGYEATCIPAVLGTCKTSSSTSCTSSANCSSGQTCVGGSVGQCSTQSCNRSSDCGTGRSCVSRVCSAASCTSDSACGARGQCEGLVSGICGTTCTSSSSCSTGYTCVSGGCVKTCSAQSDCGSSRTSSCINATASYCSDTTMFPHSCVRGDLSGQEKALEFMLFDLTACVTPDNWTPTVPTTTYAATSFNLDFAADCPSGTLPAWREFQWQAVIPDTSSIAFAAATAASSAALDEATSVAAATTTSSTLLPNYDTAFLDTTEGAFAAADPPMASLGYLRVTVTLNPTTGQDASPILSSWRVLYDCPDSE